MGVQGKSKMKSIAMLYHHVQWVVKHALQRRQDKHKRAAYKKRRESILKNDDWVLLRFHTARLRTKKGKIRLYTKLNMRYYGPFQIQEKINDVAYKLKLLLQGPLIMHSM